MPLPTCASQSSWHPMTAYLPMKTVIHQIGLKSRTLPPVPSQQAAGFSDNRENLNRWQLPNIEIPAGGYLVVFASRKTGLEALLIPTSSLKQMGNTWHWSLLMDPQLLLRSTFPVNVLTSHLALRKQPSFVSYLELPCPLPGAYQRRTWTTMDNRQLQRH